MSHLEKHESRGPVFEPSDVDEAARRAVREAAALANAVAARTVPRKTGRLAQATKARTRKTARGWKVVVATRKMAYPTRRVTTKEVSRFVQRGTGVYGPRHRPIHGEGEAMRTPAGPRWAAKGQRPQPFMAQIYTRADPPVTNALAEGVHTVH